jgi:hypothetical protein
VQAHVRTTRGAVLVTDRVRSMTGSMVKIANCEASTEGGVSKLPRGLRRGQVLLVAAKISAADCPLSAVLLAAEGVAGGYRNTKLRG